MVICSCPGEGDGGCVCGCGWTGGDLCVGWCGIYGEGVLGGGGISISQGILCFYFEGVGGGGAGEVGVGVGGGGCPGCPGGGVSF